MMAGSDGPRAVAGGLARHVPVLGRSAIELLNVRDGGTYVDATFGAGGYTRAILAAAPARVIGIDRDQRAIACGADLVGAAVAGSNWSKRVFRSLIRWCAAAGLRRSTVLCSTSAYPRCSSMKPSAAFRFGSTDRSICG